MNKTAIIIGSVALLGVGAYLYFKPKSEPKSESMGTDTTGTNTTGTNTTGIGGLSNTGTGTSNSNEVGVGTTESPIVYNAPSIEISPASLSNLQAVVYLNKYPDVLGATGCSKFCFDFLKRIKDHWVMTGKKEGRTIPTIKNSISVPTELSDDQAIIYLSKYSDLLNVFKGNLAGAKQHWVNYGKSENRTIDIVV
jgi:hypothetical protein